MTDEEILKAKNLFRERIESLKSDFKICRQGAFFPIVMYAFATIDYFSSFWAGWNKKRDRDQNQTQRIADFMKKYLDYPEKSSKIAIEIFRHKLMHTAEPRLITWEEGKEKYYWEIDLDFKSEHFLLQKVADDPNNLEYIHYKFLISVSYLIFAIETAVFGPCGYFYDLLANKENLQDKYKTCYEEFNSYEIEL